MVTLRELITADLGAPTRARGRREWYLCPFHEDHRPSMSVNAHENDEFYRCWSCGASGGSYLWLTEYRRMSPAEAMRLLEDDAQRDTHHRPRPSPAVQWDMPPTAEWQDAALDAALQCAAALRECDGAMVYLTERRGLTETTIERAMLGWSPRWREVMPGSWLAPGITIPCIGRDGLWYVQVRTTAAAREKSERAGRRLDKYHALGGSRLAALYGADGLLGAGVAVACEGEFDALLLGQALADVPVITLGSATSGVAPRWRSYLAGLDRLFVRMDADDAGALGLGKWRSAVKWCEVLPQPDDALPGDNDITDYMRSGVDLARWVREAMARPGEAEPMSIEPMMA